MAHQVGTFVTEAVVLRLYDHGEADRIVTLLTAAQGKISALAKGARRSKRRFGAALSLFGYGEATLRERRGYDLAILEGLHCARGFPHLSQELSRFSHACYACELCRELCPQNEPEPEVLTLLIQLLAYLDGLPLSLRPRVEPLRVFELRLLAAVGLGISLRRCAACGGEVGPAAFQGQGQGPRLGPGAGEGRVVPFDLFRGGILCRACLHSGVGTSGGAARPLPESVYDALVLLSGLDLEGPELAALDLPPPVLSACRDLLLSVIQHHLGKDLRAVEFIAKLNLMYPGRSQRERLW